VKEMFRDQFMAAVQFISRECAKGTKKSHILLHLQEQDMKTRTGRAWTYAVLNAEIRRLGQCDGAEGEAAGYPASAQEEQRPNKASEATSESAPGAASSVPTT
jgi:hypothetical protein